MSIKVAKQNKTTTLNTIFPWNVPQKVVQEKNENKIKSNKPSLSLVTELISDERDYIRLKHTCPYLSFYPDPHLSNPNLLSYPTLLFVNEQIAFACVGQSSPL